MKNFSLFQMYILFYFLEHVSILELIHIEFTECNILKWKRRKENTLAYFCFYVNFILLRLEPNNEQFVFKLFTSTGLYI